MAQNSSSNLPIKLFWQVLLVLALILTAWVLSQVLPLGQKMLPTKPLPPPVIVSNPPIEVYPLPKLADGKIASPLDAINARIVGAEKEILVVAKQITATSILQNLKAKQAAGVPIGILLSLDTSSNFLQTRLGAWMRTNQLRQVFHDMLNSESHLIIIDQHIVIISDLPFSQRSFDPVEPSAASSTTLGFMYIIDDPALGASLAQMVKARTLSKNQLL